MIRISLNPEGFEWQVRAETEAFVFIGCQAQGSTPAVGCHLPASDQIYFLLEGAMELEINSKDHHVEEGSIVFIPAGTPHSNRYLGPSRELHLDVIVPAPGSYGRLSSPASPEDRGGPGTEFVRRGEAVDMHEVVPGFRTLPLADRSTGSDHISFRLNEIDPGSDPLPWHIHDFDQFYFVLAGQMQQLEVADRRYTVKPMDLVVLPSGVPHRNWNDGPSVEQHLALLAPGPVAGSPADLEVDFSPTDRHFA